MGNMEDNELEVAIKKNFQGKPFRNLYKEYQVSGGITKKVLRNMLAKRFLYDKEVIEYNDLIDIANNIELETLWSLAGDAKSDLVRDVCMEKLEDYIENQDNYLMEKNKIKDKKLKKELKHKFGGK
jgi:Mor family transcriptional regulator